MLCVRYTLRLEFATMLQPTAWYLHSLGTLHHRQHGALHQPALFSYPDFRLRYAPHRPHSSVTHVRACRCPVMELDLEQARKLYDTNVWGVMAVTQARPAWCCACVVTRCRGHVLRPSMFPGCCNFLGCCLTGHPGGVHAPASPQHGHQHNHRRNAPHTRRRRWAGT